MAANIDLYGFFNCILPCLHNSKKARQEKNAKEFRKDILGVCPEWLLTTSGLIIMYGLGWFIFFIYKRYFDVSVPTNWQRIGFTSAFWMASYSLNFALLYICRCLKERTLADGD
jgi:peptidoglycan biosynthesis protein MviN/MurJ (putative lipid II flippase)